METNSTPKNCIMQRAKVVKSVHFVVHVTRLCGEAPLLLSLHGAKYMIAHWANLTNAASAASCPSRSPKAEKELAPTPSLSHTRKSHLFERSVGYEVTMDLAYLVI